MKKLRLFMLGCIGLAVSSTAWPIIVSNQADDYTGVTVVFVGAGDIGTGESGPAGADGQMRMARNTVAVADERFLLFKFDAPDSPSALDLEGISGPGDSGGPAYV